MVDEDRRRPHGRQLLEKLGNLVGRDTALLDKCFEIIGGRRFETNLNGAKNRLGRRR
jgi:hypothetical protein